MPALSTHIAPPISSLSCLLIASPRPVPPDFLVEKVEGVNVRGWEIRKEEKRQVVDVTLLNAAKQGEQFTLRLWRAGRVGQEPLAEFDCPAPGSESRLGLSGS